MATSVESPSPGPLNQGSPSMKPSSSPPMFSPSSDKRFWSYLRSRTEVLLENREPVNPSLNGEAGNQSKRLKEDSMLLLRGFDSVAQSLSQLSNNLDDALKAARGLAGPPTLTEIVHASIEKARSEENLSNQKAKSEETSENSQTEEILSNEGNKDEHGEEDDEEDKRGLKRKSNSQECPENEGDHSHKSRGPNELEKFRKSKKLAISMATKAASMARELKSIRSDLSFMHERCALLEEENKTLRNGLAKGIPPDEDDLVRLQLEALLAEKSRLANENANLTRENQCLNQLVQYHQLTTQDLSASYDNLIRGMCLDFSSPTHDENADGCPLRTPEWMERFGLSKSLDECYDEEEQE